MAALVDLVEVDDVRVARLDPAARRLPDLARERREAERDRRGRQRLPARGRGVRPVGLPVRPGRGGAGAGQPVERDVVEDVVAREVARGPVRRRRRSRSCSRRPCRGRSSRRRERSASRAARSRSSAGGWPSRRSSRFRTAGRWRSARPRRVLVGVRRHRAVQRRHEQVRVDADQALGCLAAHRVGDARADVAALGDVAGVAEPAHQLGPRLRGPAQVPADLDRLAGEAVPGQGGRGRDGRRPRPLPPCAVGSVSGPTASSSSITEPGQPWVMISGRASSCWDLTWMKWMSTPSISVTNCGSAFRRASIRPKSYSSSQ